jgi:hypothetical protein
VPAARTAAPAPLRPRLQELAARVKAEEERQASGTAGDEGAGPSSQWRVGRGSSRGGGGGAASEAAAELLWWLRCLELFDAVCYKEGPPPLLGHGRLCAAGSGVEWERDAPEACEVIDPTSEEAPPGDVVAFLEEHGWAVVREVRGGSGGLAHVRVKQEPDA